MLDSITLLRVTLDVTWTQPLYIDTHTHTHIYIYIYIDKDSQ